MERSNSRFYRLIRAKHVALGSCKSQSAQWNGSHGFLMMVDTSSFAVVIADAFIASSSCSTPFNIWDIALAVAAKFWLWLFMTVDVHLFSLSLSPFLGQLNKKNSFVTGNSEVSLSRITACYMDLRRVDSCFPHSEINKNEYRRHTSHVIAERGSMAGDVKRDERMSREKKKTRRDRSRKII